jgi:hypothetical protein
MALIAVKPFVLRDCVLAIKDGATAVGEYEAHVSRVQFNANTPTATWKGLTPSSVHRDIGGTEWEVVLDYAQDYETANSLAQYLLANPGKQVTAEFTPKKGTTAKKVTATITLLPGGIGGAQGEFATSSVTLPVTGQPVLA